MVVGVVRVGAVPVAPKAVAARGHRKGRQAPVRPAVALVARRAGQAAAEAVRVVEAHRAAARPVAVRQAKVQSVQPGFSTGLDTWR